MTALSIVFPCFDEAERLPRTFERYLAHFPADPAAIEFVVVDDGSSDGTLEVAERIAARDRRVRVLQAASNHGKGFAVRTGVLAAKGDRVVFTDADGSYGPDDVERILLALERAPVAIGVRPAAGPGKAAARGTAAAGQGAAGVEGAGTSAGPPAGVRGAALRRLASPIFNLAMRLSLGLPFHDTQCGLKGFRREAAADLFGRGRVDGFAFDAEILFLAGRLGYQVAEVPVQATDRDGSKVRLSVDALRMLREAWSVRRAAARGAYDQTGGQTRLRNHAG
jgi:dolichyl-phosphate beta-glucosyltransferase